MSQEEEGVRQVSGEPCSRAGEPEQNPHRGTQSPQRLVLPQIRVEKSPNAWQGLDRSPCTETQHRAMHLDATPPFLLFCFLFKNC